MFFAFHIRFEEKLRNLSFSIWLKKKKSSLFGFAKRKLLLKSWVWKTWKENFLKEFYHQPANFSTVVIQNKCFLYPMPIFATPFTIKPLPLPYYVLVPLPPNLLNWIFIFLHHTFLMPHTFWKMRPAWKKKICITFLRPANSNIWKTTSI